MQAEDETEVVTQDEIEAVPEDDAGTDADAEDDAGSDDTTRHTET